jgi:hypothetical protein
MKYLIWLLLTILFVVPVVAALDCPAVVENALATTDELCETTGRNQACYGNVRVDAEPQPGVDDFNFDQAGDRVAVTALQSLRLSPMEVDSGAWGVAMMRLQASIPASRPQDITLLMFGDVQIENAVSTPSLVLDVTVSVDEYINIRRLPSTRASIMGVLAPDQTVRALERLEDGSWVRIEIPDSGVIGWVDASLVTSEDDLMTLSVTERWTPRYRPMQAFYFESGENNSGCPAAPTSGLLIQTPEGAGQVTLLINEVSVRIGSTAFVEARPGEEMRVSTVEGSVEVEAMGETQTAAAGSEVSVPMDEYNEPSAPPRKPRPYNQTEWESLPVEALDQAIDDIPDPLTEEEIEQIAQTSAGASGSPTTASTDITPESGTTLALPASGGSLSLSSDSGCTWVVYNSTPVDVAFSWDAVGNGDSGGGVAPAGGSTSFSANAQTVSITFDLGNGPQSAAASSDSCGGAPASSPATQAVESTDEPSPPVESSSDEPAVDEPSALPISSLPTEEPTAEPPPSEAPTAEPPPTEPPPTEEPVAQPLTSELATSVPPEPAALDPPPPAQEPPPGDPLPQDPPVTAGLSPLTPDVSQLYMYFYYYATVVPTNQPPTEEPAAEPPPSDEPEAESPAAEPPPSEESAAEPLTSELPISEPATSVPPETAASDIPAASQEPPPDDLTPGDPPSQDPLTPDVTPAE